jgi:ABC-type hemin transport system ATPase subunit
MDEDASMVEQPPPYQEGLPSSAAVSASPQETALKPQQRPILRAGDVIIAAMGVTGAGKSTFVSLLSPDEDVEIGHDLKSSECPTI